MNFHWRWWEQIQAIFLNLFYFTKRQDWKIWSSMMKASDLQNVSNLPPLVQSMYRLYALITSLSQRQTIYSTEFKQSLIQLVQKWQIWKFKDKKLSSAIFQSYFSWWLYDSEWQTMSLLTTTQLKLNFSEKATKLFAIFLMVKNQALFCDMISFNFATV